MFKREFRIRLLYRTHTHTIIFYLRAKLFKRKIDNVMVVNPSDRCGRAVERTRHLS